MRPIPRQEGVVRVGFGQHFDDGLFGGLVDVGDEVLVVFFGDDDAVEVERGAVDDGGGAAAAFIAVLSIGCMELPLKARDRPASPFGAGTMETRMN
jgi:hypothetical protein